MPAGETSHGIQIGFLFQIMTFLCKGTQRPKIIDQTDQAEQYQNPGHCAQGKKSPVAEGVDPEGGLNDQNQYKDYFNQQKSNQLNRFKLSKGGYKLFLLHTKCSLAHVFVYCYITYL